MIALDTNVLVQFVTQNDPGQGRIARDLFQGLTAEDPAFHCLETVLELVSVLGKPYNDTRGAPSQVTFDRRAAQLDGVDRLGSADRS